VEGGGAGRRAVRSPCETPSRKRCEGRAEAGTFARPNVRRRRGQGRGYFRQLCEKEGRTWKTKVHDTRTARQRATLRCRIESSTRAAPRILQRCVTWQLAKRRRVSHDVKTAQRSTAPARKLLSRRVPASARHGQAKATCSVAAAARSGDSAQPCHRSDHEGARAGPQARALAKAKDGEHYRADKAAMKEGRTGTAIAPRQDRSRTRSSATALRCDAASAWRAKYRDIEVLPVRGTTSTTSAASYAVPDQAEWKRWRHGSNEHLGIRALRP